MNYNISPKLVSGFAKQLAVDCADRMKNGMMDEYVSAAKSVAEKNGVIVCDCYALWKKMVNCGVNVTELLANKLNHPDRDMHYIFAYELVKTVMDK